MAMIPVFFSSQVLDAHGKNVTICVPNFGQDLYRDKTLVAGLGTAKTYVNFPLVLLKSAKMASGNF